MYLTKTARRHARWQIAKADYALDLALGQEPSTDTLSLVLCPEPPPEESSVPEWLDMRDHDANILYAREVVEKAIIEGNKPSPHWIEIAKESTQREKSALLRIKAFFVRRRRKSEMMKLWQKVFSPRPSNPQLAARFEEAQLREDQEFLTEISHQKIEV